MMRNKLPVLMVAAAPLVACSSNGSDSSQVSVSTSTVTVTAQASASLAPVPPVEPASPAIAPLVNPAMFARDSGYYFQSPSGTWRCAILNYDFDHAAGCSPPGGHFGFNPPGVPAAGAPERTGPPNTIEVAPARGGAKLSMHGDASYSPLGNIADPTVAVLGYGQTLSAAGFSCNVQETGVSCRDDASGEGFTVSTSGYSLSYTPVQ